MKNIRAIIIVVAAISIMVAITIFDAPDYLFFLLFALIIIIAVTAGSKQSQFDYLQQILATSKISAVASGLAEIKGVALPIDDLLKSPIGKTPCIAFIYTVEEMRVTQNSDGKEQVSYVEIDRQTAGDRFYLQDDGGRIEVDTANMSWFGFLPANEYLAGSYRYREYILDDQTELLMIGQAWYQNNRPLFKYSQDRQILAMAPLSWVDFRNKWRPLKHQAVFMLAIFGLFVALVLVMSIQLDGQILRFGF